MIWDIQLRNVINIKIKGDYVDPLENEFNRLGEVDGTSKSSMVLGIGGATMGMISTEAQDAAVRVLVNEIDEKYLDMHEFEVLAGTGFQSPLNEGSQQKYIVVNQELLNKLNIGSPQEAVGKIVWHNGNKLMILGVVSNFINMSMTMSLEKAFAFVQAEASRFNILGVKVKNTNLLTAMDKLKDAYVRIDPIHPFEATVYDQSIVETYQQHKATYTIMSFLAFLAVSISTLGLLGMAVYTRESRMKEISVRKVLGASVSNLMLQVSKDFIVIIIISAIIAIPATLFLLDRKLLTDFLYRADTGPLEVFSGLFVVIIVTVFTIGWQIRDAAIQNPSETLRSE